jgi:hypothetical protein
MVDFLSDWTKVRKLARSVVPADFNQTQIESEQGSAASWIDSRLHIVTDSWLTTNPAYKMRVKAEQILAAIYVLNYEGTGGPELAGIQLLWDEFNAMFLDLKDSIDIPGGQDTEGGGIDRIPFRDWGRNPDIPPPNKMAKARRG